MRLSLTISAALLALLPAIAAAQNATTADTSTRTTAVVDFGVRGTRITGDGARYERYRNLGDGLFLETARWGGERRGWFIDLSGDHVGRTDQRLGGAFVKPGKFKGVAQWDQIPMLMSRTTRTLFNITTPGVLEIDNAIQAQVQAVPATLGTVFAANSREFETKSRRHIGSASVEYIATPALTVNANVKYTNREGVIPYGGSFGHSSLVEMPAPVNHTITDLNTGAEFSQGRWLLRAGATGSWFHNEFTSVAFDNPFRATDTATAPSRGRSSLPPSNSLVSVNGLASVRLPRKSRASAYVSIGSLKAAGDPLMPHTINTALAVIPLDRNTVGGQARTTAMNLSFTSRPSRYADVSVRYRLYEYDNRTPLFTITRRVGYDNAVSTLAAPQSTEPTSVERQSFDADFRVTPRTGASAGVGFSRQVEERTHRIFESTTDNTFRLTFDSVGLARFTMRTKYEHAQKRGEGNAADIAAELAAVGEQPGMRHFDIASRDRDRVTVLGSFMASDNVGLNGSIAAGKDDYLDSLFGLRDNTHRIYGAGLDATPSDRVTLGANYTFERYNALSRSRQANPGAQFLDASRNWATDATDRVHSATANAEIAQIGGKVDLRLSFDFSRARATYNYITGAVADRTLPEEAVLPTTLPTPTQLPPTLSELHRGTADATYAVSRRVSVGLSWWYERYRVTDFTLDAQANPELARGQALLIGYLYSPYTANTVWARLMFRW